MNEKIIQNNCIYGVSGIGQVEVAISWRFCKTFELLVVQ